MNESIPKAVENVKKNDVRLYPNPANDILNVVRKYPDTEITGIYNALGKLVKSPGNYDIVVDISGLAAGMYYLKLKTDGFYNAHAFIKI
jgi:hypothetical protein